MLTHPHGDRQAAIDVGFLKPALLQDASPLGAQRCRVLTHKHKHLAISKDGFHYCSQLTLISLFVVFSAMKKQLFFPVVVRTVC